MPKSRAVLNIKRCNQSHVYGDVGGLTLHGS